MFLSKIAAERGSERVSFTTILRNIELYRLRENSKITLKRKTWIIDDFSEADRSQLKLFAQGKTSYKNLLIKNIEFFHPGDLTECSNERHQQQMMLLIEELVKNLGYPDSEDRIFYCKYAFDEIFKNARRGQMKEVIPHYNNKNDVEMSKIMSEMEKKNLIPNNKKLKIKIDLLSEGFTLKVLSPVMNDRDKQLVNERMTNRFGSSNKIDYTDAIGATVKTKSHGEGNGIQLARRSLQSVHPAYSFSLRNVGNYTVTEVTLPRKIEQE